MKRLVVLILMIATGLMSGPTSAQSRELAGSWLLDAEKSKSKEGPQLVVITLTDKEFTARLGGPQARVMTFRTDGTETDISQGIKGKASWNGGRLDATIIKPDGPDTVTFSRDGAWLVVEARGEDGPMKFYFRKTPSGV